MASRSDVGRVRSVNQDACGEFENPDGYRMLVVADGMGGHAGGETASRLALETIGRVFERDFADPRTLLARAFLAANEEVHRAGAADPALHGMGTTGVALLIGPRDEGWVAHVGDSRAYRLREGRLDRITEDHSWIGEAVRSGRLGEDEAREHPLRNVLLRSIGVGTRVEASVTTIDLKANDRYLLCSDGLWGEVDEHTIAEVLASGPPADVAAELVDLANARGGSDNVTVQVAALLADADRSVGEAGAGGSNAAPSPKRLESPATPAYGTPIFPGSERSRWARPGAIAASLLAAAALFWRVCA